MPELMAVISRSATEEAAAASMQVESPRTLTTVLPPRKLPDFEASDSAISAPEAIAGVSDSIGPVKPRMTPTFTSSATTGADKASKVEAISNFFIGYSLKIILVIVPAESTEITQSDR